MKKRHSRIIAILIAMMMVIAFVAACNDDVPPVDPMVTPTPESNGGTTTDPVDPVQPVSDKDTLIVGYGVAATGDFINGFGNSAYDLSIKTLLHGYNNPFIVTIDGQLEKNPTVLDNYSTSTDNEGNKTYTLTLLPGRTWSDGTEITAKDYVTAMLWHASPQWQRSGGSYTIGTELVGYEEYSAYDEEDDEDLEIVPFAGISLISDYVYSYTIKAEELPFYGEYNIVSNDPLPLHSYAPGIDIVSDENGARFSADFSAHTDRVAETERFSPTVVCGPYTFVSFTNNIVTLQRNPFFSGDDAGKIPSIEYIMQIEVSDETDVDQLFAGEVDYLPEEIMGAKIERVKAEPGFSAHGFLRNGYGVMNMACDWGPTADRNVRWAIATLVDRNMLLDQVLEGYGGLVDTEAGEAQWMYQMKRAQLQEELIPIALNIERANAFLDETEWVFEEDGTTPFDVSKANPDGTYLRHNSSGDVLTIVHGAANAEVGAILEIEFLKNTPLAGVNYVFEYPEWDTILDQLYYAFLLDDSERYYSTFSMGMGFGVPFDPYFTWHSDWLGTWINAQQFSDPELDDHIIAMRRTEPGDDATYLEHWYNYVVRWNYMLPSIPLYSNEYFDLFNAELQGVITNPFASWYAIICDLSFSS